MILFHSCHPDAAEDGEGLPSKTIELLGARSFCAVPEAFFSFFCFYTIVTDNNLSDFVLSTWKLQKAGPSSKKALCDIRHYTFADGEEQFAD